MTDEIKDLGKGGKRFRKLEHALLRELKAVTGNEGYNKNDMVGALPEEDVAGIEEVRAQAPDGAQVFYLPLRKVFVTALDPATVSPEVLAAREAREKAKEAKKAERDAAKAAKAEQKEKLTAERAEAKAAKDTAKAKAAEAREELRKIAAANREAEKKAAEERRAELAKAKKVAAEKAAKVKEDSKPNSRKAEAGAKLAGQGGIPTEQPQQ